jgi:hypothetical protein
MMPHGARDEDDCEGRWRARVGSLGLRWMLSGCAGWKWKRIVHAVQGVPSVFGWMGVRLCVPVDHIVSDRQRFYGETESCGTCTSPIVTCGVGVVQASRACADDLISP